ncbi:uncharacterized protein VP01_3232g1 [Puccinia sorghi]|uniref:CCHC-type domain-containing protein n=1 Tax=Puccinia sorghi TaxID=27349 RepID=A0A0L6UY94_9BASI|nr:uncharacterized protein VP01_3232g1 [Puccinia sorghi]
MAPPNSKDSDAQSRASSTRSKRPTPVQPGEFDRRGLAPRLVPGDRVKTPNPPQVLPGIPGGSSSVEQRGDGPTHRQGQTTVHHGDVEPPRRASGKQQNDGGEREREQEPSIREAERSEQLRKESDTARARSGLESARTASKRREDETSTHVSELRLRGTVQDDQNPTGRISSNRSGESQEQRSRGERRGGLTLLDLQLVLSKMFTRVADGNGKLVKEQMSQLSTDIPKKLEVTLPVTNNLQLLRDIVQESFKSLRFTLSGVSSNWSSSALNVIKLGDNMEKVLSELKVVRGGLAKVKQDTTEIDRMMGQYRAEGGKLREEVASLTGAVNAPERFSARQPTEAGTQSVHQNYNNRSDSVLAELKKRLNNAIAKSDWPKFSGEGEYDHLRFVQWIDTAKRDSHVDDKVTVFKLLTMFTGTALSWYKTMRLNCQDTTWVYWKAAICKKFGHSAWRRKKQLAFDMDKFVPGNSKPSQWVTRQTINFKLMSLMEEEVEYAVKSAMRQLDADLSEFINILEDICDKTKIGRKRFQPKPGMVQNGKPVNLSAQKGATGDKDKQKPMNKNIKCYTCGETGHTSRRCHKNVNAIEDNLDKDFDRDLGSDIESEGPVIGESSMATFMVESGKGKNTLVKMTCCKKESLVLLDTGAVRSVVGRAYLEKFCPEWKKFKLPVQVGNFHSASGKLLPLGVVKVELKLYDTALFISFVVMENALAKYFIVGTDYLMKYKISVLHDEVRKFTIGKQFDESINVIRESLSEPQREQLLEALSKDGYYVEPSSHSTNRN